MADTGKPDAPSAGLFDLLTRRDVLAGTAAVGLTLAARPRLAIGAAARQARDSDAVPSRETLAQQFRHPPLEYAPVDNWWWEAGTVEKEKITWQLQELKDKGVGGTWFYVRWLYGESLSSDPRYWAPQWWDFTRYSLEEHRRLGLRHWFSNWTNLQFQQDLVRKERAGNPALRGRSLVMYQAEADGVLELAPEDELLEAAAYRKTDGGIDYSSRNVMTDSVRDRRLTWKAPGPGWVATMLVTRPWDLNYLDQAVGQRFGEVFLGEYQKRLPEFTGNTLEAFGADEMFVLNQEGSVTTLFSTTLLRQVRSRRGYDPAPYLIALFHDIGPKTDQVRCDYYDAMTRLLEENFYQPPGTWLESRGMKHATLSQLAEEPLSQTLQYGDFFRYLRTFHVTGNEDPFRSRPGERRLFESKVSSSVAHLYERHRVVLCAHYSSGWGQTQEENLAWTNESYAKGLNFYCRHGGQYSLLGGWYEWVPPSDHFYQPHWRYWGAFTRYVTRLSHILSQGKHRADVALFYPLTTLHAHWVAGRDPKEWKSEQLELAGEKGPFGPPAIEAARSLQDLTRAIYHDGMDLDVLDNDSLERAVVRGGVLEVSGIEFRSIVLPALSTIRLASMQKVLEFYEAGGTIVSFGRLPAASAENGRGDPKLHTLVEAAFGSVAEGRPAVVHRSNARGGKAYFVPSDANRVPPILSQAIVRAVSAAEKDLFLLHKRIGDMDVYFLFNVKQEARELPVRFRAQGRVEIWDAHTGEVRPAYHWARVGDELTEVQLRMGPNEGVIVVFSAGKTAPAVMESNLSEVVKIDAHQEAISVHGFDATGGGKQVRVHHDGRVYLAQAAIARPPKKMRLQEPFAFRLEPTMNNRWGDFRYPASETLIGAEARRFRYAQEDGSSGTQRNWHRAEFDDAHWPETTYSYGPYWWHLGGFRPGMEPKELLDHAGRGQIDVRRAWNDGSTELRWQPYHFSKKFGNASVLQSGFLKLFGGLLGVPDNFLVLDQPAPGNDTHFLFTHAHAPHDGTYFLHAGVKPHRLFASQSKFASRARPASAPSLEVPSRARAWVNAVETPLDIRPDAPDCRSGVQLRHGWNSILLEIVRPQTGPLAFYAALFESAPPAEEPRVPLLRWFREPQKLSYDITPYARTRVGWYRFKAPPGVLAMRLRVQAKAVQAWVDGRPVHIANGTISLGTALAKAAQVALRVEHEPGAYAGAAFSEPVLFECGTGRIALGDWSDHGLATYSGIGVYSQDVHLKQAHLAGKVILDLGLARNVAEVFVNDRSAGVKLARPFDFDITDLVRAGSNKLEIRVANTLANHMSTYPTQWVLDGQTVSGLLGPVELSFHSPVRLAAKPVE